MSARTFNAYPQSSPGAGLSFNLPPLDPVVQKHLRRVYTALATALTSAAVGAYLTLQMYERKHFWISSVSRFLVLPLLWWFFSLPQHSTKRPYVFHAFAFVDGAATAPLISMVMSVDPRIPVIAFMGAAAVFVCCSISALYAKRRSYLFLSSFLLTGTFALFAISLISSFWRDLRMYSMQLYGGLVLFCAFVLYDTQMIIEKAHIGERDHLKHAVDLLVDLLAIFKRFMIIMAKNKFEKERRQDDNRRRSASSQ